MANNHTVRKRSCCRCCYCCSRHLRKVQTTQFIKLVCWIQFDNISSRQCPMARTKKKAVASSSLSVQWFYCKLHLTKISSVSISNRIFNRYIYSHDVKPMNVECDRKTMILFDFDYCLISAALAHAQITSDCLQIMQQSNNCVWQENSDICSV